TGLAAVVVAGAVLAAKAGRVRSTVEAAARAPPRRAFLRFTGMTMPPRIKTSLACGKGIQLCGGGFVFWSSRPRKLSVPSDRVEPGGAPAGREWQSGF